MTALRLFRWLRSFLSNPSPHHRLEVGEEIVLPDFGPCIVRERFGDYDIWGDAFPSYRLERVETGETVEIDALEAEREARARQDARVTPRSGF